MHISRWVLWILLSGFALATSARVAAESDSLDVVARRYRIQVYDSFRGNRRELDRRLKAAEHIVDTWRDRGAPSEEVDGLVDWFQRATQASRFSQKGLLPEYHSAADATGTTRPESMAPPANDTPASTAIAPSPPMSADTLTHAQPSPFEQGRPTPQATGLPASGYPGPPTETDTGRPERPDDLPPVDIDDLIPQKPRVAHRPTTDRLPAMRLRKPRTHKDVTDRLPLSPAPPTSVDELAGPTQRSVNTRQSEVNLAVLAAKIRSINLSLKALEADLAENSAWSVTQLERKVGDISRLIDAAGLARIYYEAIPYEERELIEPLIDMGPIQALLAQRAFEARIRLADEARTDTTESLKDQLNRLESISEVMQQWNKDQKN